MITIKVEGLDDVLAGLKGMQRQIPYAMANGINSVARLVKDAEKAEMQRVFDRPTPYTLNSLKMTPAKAPRNVTASVWFKDPPTLSQKGHYLLPQVEGGGRPRKPFETALGRRFTVPGSGAELNQYGNLSRGQITKLLSQTGSFREGGFKANRSRKGSREGDMIMLAAKRGKLPAGVYQRVAGTETGARIGRYMLARSAGAKKSELNARYKSMYPRGLKPVLIFPTKAPTYRRRLDFYGVAQKVVDANLRPEMIKAVTAEIEREFAYRARHGR